MPRGEWRDREDAFLAGERAKTRTAVKEAMGQFVGKLVRPVTLFATFTFDPLNIRMVGPLVSGDKRAELPLPTVSVWCAARRFQYFLDHASGALGRLVVGVIATEDHRSGQSHGHGVLGIEGGLVGGEIGTLSALWRKSRGNGFIRLEVPLSEEDVTNYCAKYMAKDASDMVFSRSLQEFQCMFPLVGSK